MAERKKTSEFDYEAADADAKARLAEFPPTARARHLDGMGWVEGFPLPAQVVDAIQFLFVLADRDAASSDASSGQLKHEIRGHMGNAFEAGYEAGSQDQLGYIKAVRDGLTEPDFYFDGDAELLDGLLRDHESMTSLDVEAAGDGVSLEEILDDLRAREGR
jgi:hypothetical protein